MIELSATPRIARQTHTARGQKPRIVSTPRAISRRAFCTKVFQDGPHCKLRITRGSHQLQLLPVDQKTCVRRGDWISQAKACVTVADRDSARQSSSGSPVMGFAGSESSRVDTVLRNDARPLKCMAEHMSYEAVCQPEVRWTSLTLISSHFWVYDHLILLGWSFRYDLFCVRDWGLAIQSIEDLSTKHWQANA